MSITSVFGGRYLVDAIRADPNDPARWLALANCYADQGRADEAEAVRVL
jgi:uncharacterized protein (TIGR02996 family)